MPEPPFVIRHEDEHLLVVDKAAGIVVHPAAGNWEGTLSQLLADYTSAEPGEEQRSGIVHRLDKGTSGLLVVARTESARSALQEMIAAREVSREYLALVEGRPPAKSGTIEAPIGRDPRVRTRMAVGGAGAREARTYFEFERMLPRSTLLRVRLDTGRTHQIRVHMRAIEHPVAGDPEYGTPGLYGLERQFLHADRLRFAHPFESGTEIDVRSSLPSDLERALEIAERLS